MVSNNGFNPDWIDIGAEHYERYGECWEYSQSPGFFLHPDKMMTRLAQIEFTRRDGPTYVGHFPKKMDVVRVDISDGYISRLDVPFPEMAQRLIFVFDMFGKSPPVEPPVASEIQDSCDHGIAPNS